MVAAAQRTAKVLGLELTPETLWNLAPWSWAVDWVSNAGDVVSNISDWANDGLVLKYGYMMEETSVTDVYTFDGPSGLPGNHQPYPVTLQRTVKKRIRATPFGFGLNWSGFSPRQLAILAALGITKS